MTVFAPSQRTSGEPAGHFAGAEHARMTRPPADLMSAHVAPISAQSTTVASCASSSLQLTSLLPSHPDTTPRCPQNAAAFASPPP
jgi:hypothetical protein